MPGLAQDAFQHAHAALASHQAFHDHELDRRMGHAARSQRVLAVLQAKPDLTFADVTRALLDAAADGAITHTQALDLAAKMPSDPVGLRSFLSYLQQAATHTQGLIATEKHRRTMARGF